MWTQKANSFADKILKHYPITSAHSCTDSHCQVHQPFSHMHDHRKEREIYDKPTPQKIQNMRYFKQMGNSRFKQLNYDEAAYFYQKTIIYNDYTFPDSEEQAAEVELLVQQCNMNLAICLIKKNNWQKVETYLNQAVKGQGCGKCPKQQNLSLKTKRKGFYWLTKLYLRNGSFERAKAAIESLESLDAEGNTKQEALELNKQMSEEIEKYKKQSEKLSKKMFENS